MYDFFVSVIVVLLYLLYLMLHTSISASITYLLSILFLDAVFNWKKIFIIHLGIWITNDIMTYITSEIGE